MRKVSRFFETGNIGNFIFEVVGNEIPDKKLLYINKLTSIDECFSFLKLGLHRLKYIDVDNQMVKNNLILIDSFLPEIIGNALIYFYEDQAINISDWSNHLHIDNPMHYTIHVNQNLYEHKLKRFLMACAFGMKVNKVWDGELRFRNIKKIPEDLINFIPFNLNVLGLIKQLFLNVKIEIPNQRKSDRSRLFKRKSKTFIKLAFVLSDKSIENP